MKTLKIPQKRSVTLHRFALAGPQGFFPENPVHDDNTTTCTAILTALHMPAL